MGGLIGGGRSAERPAWSRGAAAEGRQGSMDAGCENQRAQPLDFAAAERRPTVARGGALAEPLGKTHPNRLGAPEGRPLAGRPSGAPNTEGGASIPGVALAYART